MWLLNTVTHKLRSFVEQIPEYVILSHTWEDDEVTFDDLNKPHAKHMTGYRKIIGCCKLASRDGYEWAWIDTCCIDKRSSAELSEAINSMYKWYWQAAICYAYLPDVSTNHDTWRQELESSRWFTRGWTLQELLAPAVVEFYNKAWEPIGTKAKLVNYIHKATKIEPGYLLRRNTIRTASTATKFSWAALRQTTRAEDMAYCLLGLVQVNMPMLYGEGKRAFYRLQLAIIAQTSEHSILAWQPGAQDRDCTAVLAPSPSYFEHSAKARPSRVWRADNVTTHEVTNNGLRITLPCMMLGKDRMVALLDCEIEPDTSVGIWLERSSDGVYRRSSGSSLAKLRQGEEEEAEILSIYLLLDDLNEQSYGRTKSCITFKSISSEMPAYIEGISLSSQRAVDVKLKLSIGDVHERSENARDLAAYLFRELVVTEFEAVFLKLSFGSDGTSPSNFVGIAVGFRDHLPAVRFVRPFMAYDTNWQERMLSDFDDWNLTSDYDQVIVGQDTLLQVEAKKCRDETRSSCRWDVNITASKCACGPIEDTGSDCSCSFERRSYETLDLSTVDNWVCSCGKCTRARAQARCSMIITHFTEPRSCDCEDCKRADLHACKCNSCRRMREDLLQAGGEHRCVCRNCEKDHERADAEALRDRNKLHYMECACTSCHRDNKVVGFQTVYPEAVVTMRRKRFPLLERLHTYLTSRKRSLQFDKQRKNHSRNLGQLPVQYFHELPALIPVELP